MDDRSRKLLSKDALPKAMRPEPKPHVKREFRLPGKLAQDGGADLSSLRERALGAMAAATNGTPMPPPLPAIGSAPVPVQAKPAAIKPAPAVVPKAKGKRGKTPKPQLPTPKARASSPPPVPLTKPSAEVAEKLWPAIGTPVPPPMDTTQELSVSDVSLKTPAPLPPPPVVVKPQSAGLTPAPLVIASKGAEFREATSMWFQRGEEESERAILQAQKDAIEDQAERDSQMHGSRWRTYVAAAAGALATVAMVIHFIA